MNATELKIEKEDKTQKALVDFKDRVLSKIRNSSDNGETSCKVELEQRHANYINSKNIKPLCDELRNSGFSVNYKQAPLMQRLMHIPPPTYVLYIKW